MKVGLDDTYSVSLAYRSMHDPLDADGDTVVGEYTADDNYSTHYAEVLLAVDVSNDPDFAYLALRIEPDRIGLVEYDGTAIVELDNAYVESEQGAWYDVRAVFGADGAVSVTRVSGTSGENIVTLRGISSVLLGLLGFTNTLGFSMGAAADYEFQRLEYADAVDTITAHVEWDFDAYGRKLAQSVYDGSGVLTGQVRYVYDGWRVIQEVDALNDVVLADYVHSPNYIDGVIRSRRDLDASESFDDGENFYHFTDQQHSTIGLWKK